MCRITSLMTLTLVFCLSSGVSAAQSLKEEEILSSQELQRVFEGKEAIIIASYQTESEVLDYTQQFISNFSLDPTTDWFDVFLSHDGRFAVSIWAGAASDCANQLNDLVTRKIIPPDSFCSTGESFIAAFDAEETGLKPFIGRNYKVETGTEKSEPARSTQTKSQGSYRDSVASVRSLVNENDLQAVLISEFSRESVDDKDFVEFAARFKDAFGPETDLYAMQDASGDFRLAFNYGSKCSSRGAFTGPPNLFSFGHFRCGTLQHDSHQRDGEVNRLGPAYGLEFNSIVWLSENDGTLISEVVSGNVISTPNLIREQTTNYIVLTSLPVKDTLSNGLEIQSNRLISSINLASSGTELEEHICNQAAINQRYWRGFVFDGLRGVGFSGGISSGYIAQSYGPNCLKEPLVNGRDYGEIVLVTPEFLESSSVPSEYSAVGEISSATILDFFASLEQARDEKYAIREQRLNEKNSDAGDEYSALWLYFPPIYENTNFIELDLCSTTADVELAKAYKDQLQNYFKEHISYWSFSPNVSADKLEFNDRNIGAFANYDDAYEKFQQEIQSGYDYRECDLFFGKTNVLKKIANRLPDRLLSGDKTEYSTLLSSFALGKNVSKEDLDALALTNSGYGTAEELEFANAINAPSASIVYGLIRIGIQDKSGFDQLVDDLYSILGRQVGWSDITSFTNKHDRSGDYQSALNITKQEAQDRIAANRKAKEEKAKNYPFYALIQCQFQNNAMPLAACFVDDVQTTVSLTTGGAKREVKYFNFSSIGTVENNQTQLKIDLPARYSVLAQNASDALSINLEIRKTSDDAIVFQQSQGQLYGVATHSR